MAFTWTAKASAPGTYEQFYDGGTMIAVGTKLYVMPFSLIVGEPLLVYNTVTDAWSFTAPLPGPLPDGLDALADSGGCAVGNTLWFVCSVNDPNVFLFSYNITTSTWSSFTQVPLAALGASTMYKMSVFNIGTKLYVTAFGVNGEAKSGFLIYDMTAGTWSSSSSGTHQIGYRGFCSDGNNLIFCCDGLGFWGNWTAEGVELADPPNFYDLGVIETYNVALNTWSYSHYTDPQPRYIPTCLFYNGRVYTIGGGSIDGRWQYGDNLPGSYVPFISSYNLSTDRWTYQSDLDVPRQGVMAAVVNGKLYIFSGYSNDPFAEKSELSLKVTTIAGTGDGTTSRPPSTFDRDTLRTWNEGVSPVRYLPAT